MFHTINTDIDGSVISTANVKGRPIATSAMCGDILSLVNATATTLPFADGCVDRIVALESAAAFQATTEFF